MDHVTWNQILHHALKLITTEIWGRGRIKAQGSEGRIVLTLVITAGGIEQKPEHVSGVAKLDI